MAFTERYVSVAGGGLHDGTSEANAWTWAEFFAGHAGGQRINVKAGSYGTVAGGTLQAGTAPQFTVVRGYNNTIGDLQGLDRNSDTSINDTNFPDIVLSTLIAPATFSVIQNIKLSGAPSNGLVYSTAVDNFAIIECSMPYTGTGYALRGDNGMQVYDSDLSSANTSTVIDADRYIQVIGCRVQGGTGTANIVNADDGIVEDNFIWGSSTAVGVHLNATAITTWMIKNNTIYGIGTGITLPNALQVAIRCIRNNHITDCAEEINVLYSATADTGMLELTSRTRDNTTPRTGVGDGVNIGEITTDTGGAETDYTNAATGNFTLITGAPGVDSGSGL